MNATQHLQADVNHASVSSTSHPQDTGENTSATPQRLLPERASGWDPFEVWRTRVRPPGDPAHPGWEPRR